MKHLLVLLAFICHFALACDSSECDMAALDAADLTRDVHGLTDSGARYSKTVSKGVFQQVHDHGNWAIAHLTDDYLDFLVNRSADELSKKGQKDYAEMKRSEWKINYSGGIAKSLSHDIGDHPTEELSQWLEDFYDKTELILGIDVCRALHISDLKTINCTVKIVIHACTFPMDSVPGSREDEYRRHFAEGELYYGLIPVLTWWACEAGMMAAGAPIPFVADAAEFAMAKFLAPRLSDFIFERACTQ